MKIEKLPLFFFILFSLISCGGNDSKLDASWDGKNKEYSPLKKSKKKNFERQIKVDDRLLREMAEHLFILQENVSDELKVSEGLTFGATLLHYVGNFGNLSLNSDQISKLIKGFENLTEKPVDDKIKFVLDQIKELHFRKLPGGKCRVKIYGKDKTGIVYFINEGNNDPKSSLVKIKFFQAKNGSEVTFSKTDTVQEKEELYDFVRDTGKNDSIHPDVPRYLIEYFKQESPAPILKMSFDGMIVRVLTDTIWKNIDFRFKYGWSIPLYRIGDKKIPGMIFYLKKNLAKVKISIDQ